MRTVEEVIEHLEAERDQIAEELERARREQSVGAASRDETAPREARRQLRDNTMARHDPTAHDMTSQGEASFFNP